MRRKDRAISSQEAWRILTNGEHGVLSTASLQGIPYGVPLNYCVLDGAVYFHCAPTGRKTDQILANPRVSFCVVGHACPLPESFSTCYESIILSAEAREVFGPEKQSALQGLVAKYAPDHIENGLEHINQHASHTRVFKLTIHSINGKANRA